MFARVCAAAAAVMIASPAAAATFTVTIDGSDAIFLAGRTDLTIPPADEAWGDTDPLTDDGMLRHASPTPEEILETLPPSLAVSAGDIVRVLDPAVGGIDFFNGFGPGFGPEGGGGSSGLAGFGGISGYNGPNGALVGVFLTDAIPDGATPPAIPGPVDRNIESLAPGIGQVFFIGDGQTDGGMFQEFLAPAGATRLVLGIADGFSFFGVPGAYDDNDGRYLIRVGINEVPAPIPVPAPVLLFGTGLAAFWQVRRRAR